MPAAVPEGFGQYQPLVYSGRMPVPAAVVIRLNTVRASANDEATEAAVGLLIAYSMITIGLVAAYAWDALAFGTRWSLARYHYARLRS